MRFDKPERPYFFEVNAWPKVKKGQVGDKSLAGQKQRLKSILRPVKRGGKTVGWSVFFRTNEPAREYYLRVSSGWKKEPHSRASYGRVMYGLHVETR